MKMVVNHPVACLIALWSLVAITVARIDLAHPSGVDPVSETAAFLVTETRQLAGRELYRSSDIYFHRGARPQPREPAREDRLTRLRAAISPVTHTHLGTSEIPEIMPWLLATIRMDPDHIEAWRVAAFWLAAPDVGKAHEAETLLLEAHQRHPDDHRPLLDLARLRLRRGDFDKAVVNLDRALEVWRPDPPRASRREAELELTELLTYRGLCDEIEGNPEAALQRYDRILEIMPNARIIERRDALRSGESPELPPTAWVQESIRQRHEDLEDCDHHHHHH